MSLIAHFPKLLEHIFSVGNRYWLPWRKEEEKKSLYYGRITLEPLRLVHLPCVKYTCLSHVR